MEKSHKRSEGTGEGISFQDGRHVVSKEVTFEQDCEDVRE